MKQLLFIALCVVFSVCGYAQQTVNDNLTRNQKQHLMVYRQINQLILKGTTDQRKFYQAIYGPIAESNKQMKPLNEKEAQAMLDRANRALRDNKLELAGRLQQAAQLYAAMAKVNGELAEAFEKRKVGESKKLLQSYVEIENTMLRAGLRPLKREWFTHKEAEILMVQLAQNQRK
ncbi:MAG: hypothetical protein ACOX9E_14900 [Lentisphaeria bacterium]|jgi:polyribonucleotide nucleotidyltransferase